MKSENKHPRRKQRSIAMSVASSQRSKLRGIRPTEIKSEMKDPWKKDTNAKYSDVVKTIMGLSTASLLLPIFMIRNILITEETKPLTALFSCSIYCAWLFFGASILAGIFFQYLSAKWIRLAWGKEAGIFWSKDTKESTVECYMEWSFWVCIALFFIGLIFTMVYFVSYKNGLSEVSGFHNLILI